MKPSSHTITAPGSTDHKLRRVRQSRLAHCVLGLAGLLLAASAVQAGSATWVGATGTGGTNWSNTASWSNSVPPAPGDDLVIADATVTNLFLDDSSHTIGSFKLGTNGTRTTAFTVIGSASLPYATNALVVTGGLVASNVASTALSIRAPITIQGDQTWTVNSTAANAGTMTVPRGVSVGSPSAAITNNFTLNGTLTKRGLGMLQLSLVTLGSGNIAVQEGSLYFSSSSLTGLSVGGTGAITVGNGAKLYLYSGNPGTFDFTKTVVMNNGSTLFIGNSLSGVPYIGSPITWNGTNTLSFSSTAGGTVLLTNSWSGSGLVTLTTAGASPYQVGLLGDNSGFAGKLSHNAIGGGSTACLLRFMTNTAGSAAAEWALNNKLATFETYGNGVSSIQFGALSGTAGTLRNTSGAGFPATVTVGALNTSTTCGANIVDNTDTLGLIKVGTGTLTLAGTNTYTGGTVIGNGTVVSASPSGSGIGNGPVTVKNGGTLSGIGPSTSSAVTVESGGTLDTPGGSVLALASLSLGAAGTDRTTNSINVAAGGQIDSGSALSVSGTNFITITGGNPVLGVYDLIKYTGTIGGAGFAGFKLGSLPLGMVANLLDSGTAIQLNVTALTIEPIIWVGNLTTNWNLAGQANWKGANTGTPQAYQNGYSVTFDDSASVTNVALTNSLAPSSVTMGNNTRYYTFSGKGGIVGATPLIKNGPGTALLLTSNNYAGGTLISNGTLQVGNGSTNGWISGAVQTEGRVVFNRSDAIAFSSALTGAGVIEQRGPGTLTLSGAQNGFSGTALVSGGTLIAGPGAAPFGDTSNPIVVTNGGTLDVALQTLGEKPVMASGAGVGSAGALVNGSSGANLFTLQYLTLSGHTTLGGVGDWRLQNPSIAYQWAGITGFLHANGYSLTKVGANLVDLMNLGDTGLGDITIRAGTLMLDRLTTLGYPTNKLAIYPGATLQLRATSQYLYNPLEKIIVMTNATLVAEFAQNNLFGSLTLAGTNTFDVSTTAAYPFTLGATVDGPGVLAKTGVGTLIIASNALHTGGTTVSGGVLEVDGTLGSGTKTVTVGSSAWLTGNGVIQDSVTLQSGATLAPGVGGVGALTVGGALSLAAGSINRFDLDLDNSTNDFVQVTGSLTYGGTLFANSLSATIPVAGAHYKLFQAGSYHGAFASIQPARPADGLVWDTSTLASGILSVQGVATNPTNLTAVVTGTNLVVSWPADHLGWHLETQTSPLDQGLNNNWIPWPNSDNLTSVTIPIDPAKPTVFVRLAYP